MTRPASVSIAIRAFRRAWLADAMRSVLEQTYRDLELVVYDDAGDLGDEVSSFHDPRVRYVRATSKLHASGRFAAAVALCRGSYVGVLDDDDAYAPTFVERLVAVLEEHPRAGAAVCAETPTRRGRPGAPRAFGPPGKQADVLGRMLRDGWVVPPSAMLLRREAIDDVFHRFPMPDGVSPDRYIGFHFALRGWEHVIMQEALVTRRRHADQITGSLTCADYAIATEEGLTMLGPELDAERRRSLARRYIGRAAQRLEANRCRDARADLHAAHATDPSSARHWRRLIAAATYVPWLSIPAVRLTAALRGRLASWRPDRGRRSRVQRATP